MIAAIRRRVGVVTHSARQDRGISLVELIVAMMIFSILLAMTVAFFTSASRATSVDKSIDTTTRSASTGLDEVARMLRGATTNPVLNQQIPDPAFVQAYTGDNTIRFYSQVNLSSSSAQPVMVQFSLNGTNLVEQIWQPTQSGGYYTFAGNPTTTRTIASPVVLPASGGPNLFSYIDTNNASITTTGGYVPTASISAIAAVTVSLQVGKANTTSQSTLLTNTVGLPNLPVTRTLIP